MSRPDSKFQLRLGEYLTPGFSRFDSKLRIPVSGSILLSKEIKRIIDTPEFQRLRGIRQLGPTIFVFPGANHTRFEHSLGTYFLALRYLDRLTMCKNFPKLAQPLHESIRLVVLSALLHDIGHYPYSHWIEEIKFPRGITFPDHEHRAREILCQGKLKNYIEREWQLSPDAVSDMIAGEHLNGRRDNILNSIINSIIDVDKLDYLVRDSVHCGVGYGYGIDVERLLDSLDVGSKGSKICVTEKGRSVLLSVLTCRNIMYQEVYWHKSVRACTAMFKRFFYEYVTASHADEQSLKRHLSCPDGQFINIMREWAKENSRSSHLEQLISPFAYLGRKLYKPAYVFYRTNPSELRERSDTRNFFRKLLSPQLRYDELVDMSNKLAERLKKHIPKISPLELLLETTPFTEEREYSDLEGVKIWNTKKQNFESCPPEIEPLNKYLGNNRQAYIFCASKYYEKMKRLARRGSLNRLLGDI